MSISVFHTQIKTLPYELCRVVGAGLVERVVGEATQGKKRIRVISISMLRAWFALNLSMHGRLSCMCDNNVLSVDMCGEWALLLLPLLAKAQRRRQKLIELLIVRADRRTSFVHNLG